MPSGLPWQSNGTEFVVVDDGRVVVGDVGRVVVVSSVISVGGFVVVVVGVVIVVDGVDVDTVVFLQTVGLATPVSLRIKSRWALTRVNTLGL